MVEFSRGAGAGYEPANRAARARRTGFGGEGAGEVVSVGKGVTGFKPGDRVLGRCAGAFSEQALFDQAETIAMPSNLTWEEAASISLTSTLSSMAVRTCAGV